jgi:LysM repeat protein
VNTSPVTDFRRSLQSKLALTFRSKQRHISLPELAFRCAKGFALALAIGVAGSIASTAAMPQEPALAASTTPKPGANKPVVPGEAGKPKASKTAKSPNAPRSPMVPKRSVPVSGAVTKPHLEAVKISKSQPSKHSGSQLYHVRAGESLSLIASAQNTTVAALVQTNRLKLGKPLLVGQKLRLPNVALDGPKGLPARLRADPKRLAVRKHTAKWAKANSIPQDLLEATLWQESGFDQTKVSSTGAIGVGQIMPDTAGFIEKELIGVDLNPRITENNVRMSARYLRYLLKVNHSNATKALHAYYQGMSSIQTNGLYDDTIKYARNVQALRRHFKE